MKFENIINKIKEISVLTDNSKFDKAVPYLNVIPVYGFYHIYCVNDWKRIAELQLNSLQKSGLYEIVQKIFVCLIKTRDEDVQAVRKLLPEKFELTIVSDNPLDYEFPIIQYLYDQAQKEDFNCFYYHAKGSTILDKTKTIGVDSWRAIMEYFIFDKYNIAINALANGYNCYGSLYRPFFDVPFFAGNFWWTKSKYAAKLPNPSSLRHDRYNAESWIGMSTEDWNPYVPYNSRIDTYTIIVPDFLYKNRKLKYSDILPVAKCYLTHIFRGIKGNFKDKFNNNKQS